MAGRFARRNRASVTLDDDQVALVDAIALACYGAPRTRLIAKALEVWLPLAIAEIEKDEPGKAKKIHALAAKLRAHVELPAGVVDLGARRLERQRAKARERL